MQCACGSFYVEADISQCPPSLRLIVYSWKFTGKLGCKQAYLWHNLKQLKLMLASQKIHSVRQSKCHKAFLSFCYVVCCFSEAAGARAYSYWYDVFILICDTVRVASMSISH
ncbi:hypothetical protein A4A49_07140 [Nicotiana attenuata]|uniref:Uncharacterized protein n=1 Tax=Nicotiana attenuata TaxID=49451 RepID=A0A314KUV5_NICAT|nr:hypothetical protein A4A49_07140 [Nicotiana attenuata]